VRNVDFSRALAKVLSRPFLPFGPPDAMLSLLRGEVTQVITKGQKVLPEAAQRLGFSFQYPDILPALHAIFARAPKAEAPAKPVVATTGHHASHH
jgi:NAD dependent epimerase/dehydratase family enzyme